MLKGRIYICLLKIKISLIAIFFVVSSLSAQEKVFEREYTYKASELDSKISARTITINQLRLTLLNEIGVYVESESLLKTTDVDNKFSQDFVENIATISAGVTKFTIIDEKWDGETFWMKASIIIDEKEISETLKRVVSDRQRMKEMENLRLQLNAATEELENLKKMSEVRDAEKKDTKEIEGLYNSQINKLDAGNNFLNGNQKFEIKDYEGAIKDYNKAIEINPNFELAYNFRGLAKFKLQNYEGAIVDYGKVIEIDPNDRFAYNFIANAKFELQDYKGAIADYSKAIEIDPNDPFAYNFRAYVKSLSQLSHPFRGLRVKKLEIS